jgi:excisionase family DNA binding protein
VRAWLYAVRMFNSRRAPVTVSEAARRAMKSEDTIRRRFDDGTLAGFKTSGGMRLIDPESLDAFARNERVGKCEGRRST